MQIRCGALGHRVDAMIGHDADHLVPRRAERQRERATHCRPLGPEAPRHGLVDDRDQRRTFPIGGGNATTLNDRMPIAEK